MFKISKDLSLKGLKSWHIDSRLFDFKFLGCQSSALLYHN